MDDLDERLLSGVSATLPQFLPPRAYWEPPARRKLDAAVRPGELFLYYDPIGYREPHGVAMQRDPAVVAGVVAATDQRLLFATEYAQVPLLGFEWSDIASLEQQQRSWWRGGRKYMRELTLATSRGDQYGWDVGAGLADTLVMQWSMRRTTTRPSVTASVAAEAPCFPGLASAYPGEYACAIKELRALPSPPRDPVAWTEELCRRIAAGSDPSIAAAQLPLGWRILPKY